ncbi:MAG: SusC/RagA family TonB-linked outer membrane protein [Rikenellaceae bacterium]|nr:SusC/RagA family TonB-linked outer membrane protein [Rikenellaceae bacterium]
MKIFRYIYILLIGMLLSQTVEAQTVLSGIVTDKAAAGPLVGASVYVEDASGRTLDGYVTGIKGEYRLRIPAQTEGINIVFAFIGYKTVTVPYTGQSTINMDLESDVAVIETASVVARRVDRNPLGIADTESTAATQKITLERLETAPVTNIVEALQGALANVDVLVGADPGSGSSIRIRGTSSLSGSQNPLIVVDGVPFPVDIDESFDFGVATSEDYGQLLNLSPADLESIEVLKDATATALWGSRGSNGVLVITTKSGQKGRMTVSFSTKFSVNKEANTIPLLNGSQYVAMIQDAIWNTVNDVGGGTSYLNLLYDTPEISYDPNWVNFNEYNQNTDWVKEITQVAYTTDNRLNLSGGGDKTNYYLSLGYVKEGGTQKNTDYQRFNAVYKMTYLFSDKLRVSAQYELTRGIRDRSVGNITSSSDDGVSNVRSQAISKMPNMSPYVMNADGTTRSSEYFTPYDYFQGTYPNYFNPVAAVNESTNQIRTMNNKVQFDLIYNVLPGLTYTGTLSVTINTTKQQRFLPQSVSGVNWLSQYYNRSSDYLNDSFNLYTSNSLTYIKDFGDLHTLTLSGFWRTTEKTSYSYNSIVSANASSSMTDPVVGGLVQGAESNKSGYRELQATLYGQYMLMNRYIVNAGVNIEANSRMSPDARWGAFPNAGAAWKMQEEPFMESLPFVSEAKLRFSWGMSGNGPSSDGAYYGRFTAVTPGYLDMSAFNPSTIQLDRLKFEKLYNTSYGFDFALFDWKLDGSFDVYTKTTKDLLQRNVKLPSTTGYSTVAWYNSGELRNRGWEFYINYVPVNTKDWHMKVSVNLSQNETKLISLPDNLQYDSYTFGNGNYAYKIVEGNPLGSFYGYKYLGVYQNVEDTYVKDANGNIVTNISGNPVRMKNGTETAYPGDAKYLDVNGDGVIDENDVVYLGSSFPTLIGGFQLSLTYKKSLRLGLNFQGRYGQKIINQTRINMENMRGKDNQSTAVLKRWRAEGDDTDIPRALYSRGYNYLGSDRFVEDGSFLRLKTVSLSYKLPQTVLRKLRLTELEVYATVYDVWTITNYTGQDPEVKESSGVYIIATDSAYTPKPLKVALGVNLKF